MSFSFSVLSSDELFAISSSFWELLTMLLADRYCFQARKTTNSGPKTPNVAHLMFLSQNRSFESPGGGTLRCIAE